MTVHSAFVRYVLLGAACLWTGAVIWGCDTTVDLPEDPAKAFSMYGSLSPRLDTQTVKVYPMGARLQQRRAGELDAEFTSVDLETGERVTWRDSILVERDGDPVHVFWAPFRVEYGHTYRVRIAEAERGTSRAVVRVPEEVDLDPGPARIVAGNVQVEVDIPGREEVLPEAVFRYEVEYNYAEAPSGATQRTRRTVVRLRNEISRLSSGERRVSIYLDDQIERINQRLADIRGQGYAGPCCLVELLELNAQIQIVNREWRFPGDSISAVTVAQPGQLSNVENGFGFVGAGYRVRVNVPVDEDVAVVAGFQEEI